MITAVVTQPNYLPWLGYFEQIIRSDIFVFLDTVQYERRAWQNRNRLKNYDDKPFWLTVPVVKHKQKTPINKINIINSDWQSKHLYLMKTFLGHTKYFNKIYPIIECRIKNNYQLLSHLNIDLISDTCKILNIKTKFIRASELQPKGKRTELLVNICKLVGASHYYSSLGAKMYMEKDEHLFYDAGINLKYQTWDHPHYNQKGNNFISHLSALDAIMNIGPDQTSQLIR